MTRSLWTQRCPAGGPSAGRSALFQAPIRRWFPARVADRVVEPIGWRIAFELVPLLAAILWVHVSLAAAPATPAATTPTGEASEGPAITVIPSRLELQGNFARAQLLVVRAPDGGASERSPDLTTTAVYSSEDSRVATVDGRGRVLAIGNGTTRIRIQAAGQTVDVPVVVRGVTPKPDLRFVAHIRPVLSKAGCNMGACHASQYGKGGLKLTVFGFDPRSDHQYITRDRQGRRVNYVDPDASLLLLKPTMQVPHGGGRRLKRDSVDYQILRQWIANGAPGPERQPPVVKELRVTPAERVAKVGEKQQLRVEAVYADGTVRDVTHWARFDSMDEGMLAVTDDGLVTTLGRGQAPVMARFEGQAAVAMFVVPYREGFHLTGWKPNNFIDELAAEKFEELGIDPSPVCDDSTFIRRAFLDALGTLPSPEVTARFLADTDPNKREKLVDQILGLTGDPKLDVYNDAYSAYWALKWSDLIGNTSNGRSVEQAMWAFYNWIRAAFREDRPFDQVVRELITGKGSIYMNGPANYFRIHANSSRRTEATAQLFLGIRLECAKCHHHPFEKYSQEDYQGFARFFAGVGTKTSQEFGLFGREQVVRVVPTPTVKAVPLEGEPVTHPLDLRIPLAEWLTSPDNPYFARSVVNRYVAYLLGRGLVEPVDDMRSTNPPTNARLLNALAEYFVQHEFRIKHLLRAIMTSRLYQLSSIPTPTNAADFRFYSHYRVKRIPAEPLLDAIDAVTGVQTKFTNLPLGTRAIELPDGGAEYSNYFLKTFGKPKRASVCECERSSEANLAQTLHVLNGDTVMAKIADKKGRIARLLAAKTPHEEIVRQLYLAALCRYPTSDELAASREFLKQAASPREFYEDLMWTLLNSKEFLFIH